MMNQMSYPYLPQPFMLNPNDYGKINELEQRINRLERQVKRLEGKVFDNEFQSSDYSASPPKDNGMYMM